LARWLTIILLASAAVPLISCEPLAFLTASANLRKPLEARCVETALRNSRSITGIQRIKPLGKAVLHYAIEVESRNCLKGRKYERTGWSVLESHTERGKIVLEVQAYWISGPRDEEILDCARMDVNRIFDELKSYCGAEVIQERRAEKVRLGTGHGTE